MSVPEKNQLDPWKGSAIRSRTASLFADQFVEEVDRLGHKIGCVAFIIMTTTINNRKHGACHRQNMHVAGYLRSSYVDHANTLTGFLCSSIPCAMMSSVPVQSYGKHRHSLTNVWPCSKSSLAANVWPTLQFTSRCILVKDTCDTNSA